MDARTFDNTLVYSEEGTSFPPSKGEHHNRICKEINELIEISRNYDDMATVAKMKEIVPEYKSNNSIYEKLDKKPA